MPAGLEILASINVTRVAQAIVDITTLPQPLLFYKRARRVQATDDEITMRERSYVYAADIIATDARAQIRDAGEYTFETTRIAKVKHGFGLSESQMQLLNRIENSQASAGDVISFESYVARRVGDLVLGVQQRLESMLIGMLLDGYSYDRLGIRLTGTWGMPAEFKITPDTDWDETTSTPITDMIALKVLAQQKYGEVFNRVTMSLTTLQHILNTTQFKELYKSINFRWNVPDGAIITADTNAFATVVGTMVGMTLEVYDGMYREHNQTGAINDPIRFLPENIVLFTNSSDDNSSRGWDFAQGIVMETVVGRFGGSGVYGGFPSDSFGPVSYATQADPMLNPPGIVLWCVDRGAPRKNRPTCSAKITAWSA